MRIGILTFHYAHNYGAVLQAFALKSYLESVGCEVSILDYRNEIIQKNYNNKIDVKFGKNDYRHPRRLLRSLFFEMRIPFMQNSWLEKCHKFRMFIDEYLINNNEEYECLKKNKFDGYDCLIVGSDQVWASNLTGGLDVNYFLDFDTNSKRCSYAASMTYPVIPDSEIEYIKKTLSKFDYISVRENSLKKEIQEKLKLNVVTVVDPTLLLNCDDYKKVISSKKVIDGPFVFAYFIVDDKKMWNIAKQLSELLGIKLVELHYYDNNIRKKEGYYANMGPSEFLWCIKNADCVITNSFHGIVFSLIFKKKFFSVYGNDMRKDDLLSMVGLSENHIQEWNPALINCDINYDEVTRMIEEKQKQSYEYIKKIIGK